MTHHFNTKIAEQYGIVEAVIIENFYFWIQKNKANGRHLHDGRYWTYNSCKALAELFPYLTEKQINYAIEKLVKAGVMYKGNHNQNAYDRTLWYALDECVECIYQNSEMDIPKKSNPSTDNVEPIPDTKHIQTDSDSDGTPGQDGVKKAEDWKIENMPHAKILHSKLTPIQFMEQVMFFRGHYPDTMLREFHNKWKQRGTDGRMKFQHEMFWSTDTRLATWQEKQIEINNRTKNLNNGSTITHRKPNGENQARPGVSESRTTAINNWGRKGTGSGADTGQTNK